MRKKIVMLLCLSFPVVLFALNENEMDWRYGRYGVRVVTNAPSRAEMAVATNALAQSIIGFVYSPSNLPPAQSSAFATNAGYSVVSGLASNALTAVAVTGPQSNLIATALQPVDTNGWTVSPHLAWITNETDAAALATLATNRVTTTWDTNGHWYVESGNGTKTEYWTTVSETNGIFYSGAGSARYNGFFERDYNTMEGTILYRNHENETYLFYQFGMWYLKDDAISFVYVGDDPLNLEAYLESDRPNPIGRWVITITTNSITRYLSSAPALTNETWNAADHTNWMAVAGTNWVDNLITGWWFYERANWVSADDLNPILHPDPLPQYAMHAEVIAATNAVTTNLTAIINAGWRDGSLNGTNGTYHASGTNLYWILTP